MPPPEPSIRFTLNLPWKICEALDDRARRNRRSRTQELVVMLEDCLSVARNDSSAAGGASATT